MFGFRKRKSSCDTSTAVRQLVARQDPECSKCVLHTELLQYSA